MEYNRNFAVQIKGKNIFMCVGLYVRKLKIVNLKKTKTIQNRHKNQKKKKKIVTVSLIKSSIQ